MKSEIAFILDNMFNGETIMIDSVKVTRTFFGFIVHGYGTAGSVDMAVECIVGLN